MEASEEEDVDAKKTFAEDVDEDEAVIEDVNDDEPESEEVEAPKMKDVVVDEWIHMNSQPPIWMRCV